MLDDNRSHDDPGRRLENAFLAYLERRERGEVPDLSGWLQHDPEARAALQELIEDDGALGRWFGPLRAVTQAVGVGRFLGNYELLEVVARGGQGMVYRAREVHTDKIVALKLVNPRDLPRSLRELQIVVNLEHEHLVRVYHVGEHEGRLYFTMKLAENGSLAERIDAYGLPVESARTPAAREAIEKRKQRIACFVAKIARAVDYIHEQHIIHRDLKPGNILLDARGEPLVADFGLALRLGEAEDGAGTPGFMAPEQASRSRHDVAPPQDRGPTDAIRATDVYALGVILYKLLANRTPFVGTRSEMIARTANIEDLAPLPSVYNRNVGAGSDLDLICLKCLAKQPDRRYASAAALADDLDRFSRGDPTSVRPPGPLEIVMRRLVGAINHTVPLPGLSRWGTIDLWAGGLNLALGVALYALIRTDQPRPLLWVTWLTCDAVWWWVFLTYIFRRDPLVPAERDVALLWAGVDLASLTLFWLYCPPFGQGRAADMLALFPPWAVVNGLALLVVGRLFWGRYHLLGLGHFVVAVLMSLRLDLAPLIWGGFTAVGMACAAWDHYRTARRVGSSPKEPAPSSGGHDRP
jgi:serine/threonine-protein kinase